MIRTTSSSHRDAAVAETVQFGESYETAIRRGAAEELGLKDLALQQHSKFLRQPTNLPSFFCQTFSTVIAPEQPLTVDTKEVAEIGWFTADTVRQMLHDDPDQLAASMPWALNYFAESHK
jgi:NADH pyrophosphatase NudC (nudix superfamily)